MTARTLLPTLISAPSRQCRVMGTFSFLPAELVLEIAHQLPQSLASASFFSPLLRYEHSAPARRMRTEAICALRMTCRRFADVLFALLYESVDRSREIEGGEVDPVAERMRVAVRSVHVSLRTWLPTDSLGYSPSSGPLLPFLAFLHTLPALTRVEIADVPDALFGTFAYAFSAYADRPLPSVAALVLPDALLHIPDVVRAFPGVRVLGSPTLWARKRYGPFGAAQNVKMVPGPEWMARARGADGVSGVSALLNTLPRLTRLALSGGIRRYAKPALLCLRALPLVHLSLVYESPDPADDPPQFAPRAGSRDLPVADPESVTEVDVRFLGKEELIECGREILLGDGAEDTEGEVKLLEVWEYDLREGFVKYAGGEEGPITLWVGGGRTGTT
ncbi:hypothetical protein HMN09_00857500 [Mycena chlorophos]|uniref:Uncharacterized protein n=1 Tax=Mycena chlorophos TaxID=658473 RepID=A0A8H6W7I6_MYCCL|nr:hypothetical protein HMN09_00857500 [Mycena chlorophos]